MAMRHGSRLGRYALGLSEAVHGTSARWHAGCHCSLCRQAHSDTKRAWRQAQAQKRLPLEVRQQLLDAIYSRRPFRTVLRELELTLIRCGNRPRTTRNGPPL
jgi:hypothetical protein